MRRALLKAISTSLALGAAACAGQVLLGDASTSGGDNGGTNDGGLPTNSNDLDGASSSSRSGSGVRSGTIEFGTFAVDGGVAVGSCSFPFDGSNSWLLFDSDAVDYNRDLYAMRADGSRLLRLTNDLYNEQNPTISPNGRSLAFVSDRSGSNQIYVEDLVTGALAQLTTIPTGADQPSWSSDNAQIAFHSDASVWIMAADGSGQRIVAMGHPDDGSEYMYPSLSHDGTQVVFEGPLEILAVQVDGTGTRYIVPEAPRVSQRLPELGGWERWHDQASTRRRFGSEPCASCSRASAITRRSGRRSLRWPGRLAARPRHCASGYGRRNVIRAPVLDSRRRSGTSSSA